MDTKRHWVSQIMQDHFGEKNMKEDEVDESELCEFCEGNHKDLKSDEVCGCCTDCRHDRYLDLP